MPADLSALVKKEIIMHLEADPGISALCDDRIYGMSVPAKTELPFIRYGVPISGGYEASCWDGSVVQATLHVFAETTESAAGEDTAIDIASMMVKRMESFAPSSVALVDNIWVNSQVMRDGDEADQYHAIVQFTITAVTRH